MGILFIFISNHYNNKNDYNSIYNPFDIIWVNVLKNIKSFFSISVFHSLTAAFGTDTDIEHISCKSTTRTWTYIWNKRKELHIYWIGVWEIQEKSMEMNKKKFVCRKYNPHHWSVMSFSFSYVVVCVTRTFLLLNFWTNVMLRSCVGCQWLWRFKDT